MSGVCAEVLFRCGYTKYCRTTEVVPAFVGTGNRQ